MSEIISVRQPRLLDKVISLDGVHLKEAARLHPLSQPTELNARIMSTATLTLPESDPELGFHDLVELYTANGSAGIFWVVGQEPDYGKNRTYKLNHAIDMLSAAIYPYEETFNSTTSRFISTMLSAQTQKIGNTPFWQFGTCEDSGDWFKELSYNNVLEALSEVEKDREDYHFVYDFSTFPWTISFVRFSDTVVSEFRLSRNIEKNRISLNDSNLCTRLYLSVTTRATVTENDQNAGDIETQEFLCFNNAEGQALWGIIDRAAGIETDKVPDVQAFVQEYFRKHSAPELSLTIDGEEIVRLTGDTIDEAHLGGMCRVAIPRYAVLFNERILTVRYPDAQKTPLKITVTMANKRNDMAGSIASVRKTASQASSTASSALRSSKNNSTKLKQLAYQFEDETGNLRSMIEMNAEHLRTEFENTKEQLMSKYEQTAEHFRWSLEDAKEQLTSNMELTAERLQTNFDDRYNQLSSHFEMTAAHLQTQFENRARGLESALELTAEHLQMGFEDKLFGFKSEFEVNAQHMQANFTDRLRQMESTFELSAQHMQASFTDRINLLESTFELNAAHLRTEFYNQVEGLQSEFEVNARNLNYATTKADENGNILAKAGLYIGTDGNIAYNYNAVNGVGTQFQQHADAIGTVVGTYNGRYFIKAGEVVDSINGQTGQTVHKVDMDKIELKNNAIIGCINDGPGTGETAMTINFNRLNLTSGTVIKLINGTNDSSKINANKLVLDGYLQVTGLDTELADATKLNSRIIRSYQLYNTNSIQTGSLYLRYQESQGSAVTNENILDHYHTISCNSSGDVTLGTATFTRPTANFNIADTNFFRNSVSAKWNEALTYVSLLRKYVTGGGVETSTSLETSSSNPYVLGYGELLPIYVDYKSSNENAVSHKITGYVKGPASQSLSITGSWNATGLNNVGNENTYHVYNNNSEVHSKVVYLSSYGNDTIVAREDDYSGSIIAKINSKYSDGWDACVGNIYIRGGKVVGDSVQNWTLSNGGTKYLSAADDYYRIEVRYKDSSGNWQSGGDIDIGHAFLLAGGAARRWRWYHPTLDRWIDYGEAGYTYELYYINS